MEHKQTFELADIVSERLIALIIDSVIVGVVGNIFGIGGGAGFLGGGLLSFIIGAAYQWYFLTQQNGQTPGKMIMNIRVIKTDGTKISDADAILRFIGYYIDTAFIALGWFWAFIDSENQGWHDKIAKTYVVKVDKAAEKLKNG
ncbi:MAG: RDD family protein [Aggregatilineales bacterium]